MTERNPSEKEIFVLGGTVTAGMIILFIGIALLIAIICLGGV